jgi:hypothetical protein
LSFFVSLLNVDFNNPLNSLLLFQLTGDNEDNDISVIREETIGFLEWFYKKFLMWRIFDLIKV